MRGRGRVRVDRGDDEPGREGVQPTQRRECTSGDLGAVQQQQQRACRADVGLGLGLGLGLGFGFGLDLMTACRADAPRGHARRLQEDGPARDGGARVGGGALGENGVEREREGAAERREQTWLGLGLGLG